MTESNEKKQPQLPNEKQTLEKSFGSRPTRRPKPKPLRDGIEFLTVDRIKGFRKP